MWLFRLVVERFFSLVRAGQTYYFLIPIYVTLLGGERLAYFVRSRRWDERDAMTNGLITIAYLVRDTLVGHLVPVALLALIYEHVRVFTLGTSGVGWSIAFLFYDLAWYVDHRIGHRTGIGWAFHQVHHSSREFNFTVASRGFALDPGPLQHPTSYLLPVLGVSPFQFIAVQIVTNVIGIAQHTRLVGRLPILDHLFATPSNHRVHHGADAIYLDRNYGEVLMLWDRLFGTYQRERHEPTFGLTKNIETYDPFEIQVAGFAELRDKMQSARRWSDKLRYLVKPPDWRHDAPGETAAQGAEMVAARG